MLNCLGREFVSVAIFAVPLCFYKVMGLAVQPCTVTWCCWCKLVHTSCPDSPSAETVMFMGTVISSPEAVSSTGLKVEGPAAGTNSLHQRNRILLVPLGTRSSQSKDALYEA